jgi:two-component system sensor histidine kinase MtrB
MRGLPRGLRARSAGAFALLALLLSTVLSVATYQLARWYLLDQRQDLATRQAQLHAQVVSGQLSGPNVSSDEEILDALASTRGRAVIDVDGTWYSAVVDLNETRIPTELIEATRAGVAQRQRIIVNQVPYFVVGVPLPDVATTYFEFVPATEYERTLRTLAFVLASVASLTTAVGAAAGWTLSRRVLQPLTAVTETARAMSSGDLQRRLEVGDDPDLLPMAQSFNTMAVSLEDRIAREQRFTADVSHELRTPLTAMGSAVALAQRSSSPDRTAYAIDVLAEQVEHLRLLTLELLELSRIDAAGDDPGRELVDVGSLAAQSIATLGIDPEVLASPGIPVLHEVNPLRFERALANLLENAERYGAGATHVSCSHVDGTLRVVVDDRGPGVAPDERTSIFGRFHRGAAATAPGLPKGTGLGLSLVEEYVRLEGGRVWVEDAPHGGARFVVEVPPRS